MYWQDDKEDKPFVVPENVLDLLFQIDCPTLPVDHAWLLQREIRRVLPWFGQGPGEGLHIIHGADSGNGWERPQAAAELLHLSRRIKLTLRLPQARIDAAGPLSGARLDIAGHSMRIGVAKPRKLALTNILYTRYLAGPETGDEELFIAWAVEQLQSLGVRFKKVLCGRRTTIERPEGALQTRSLMVADLPYPDAVRLQEQGIGPHRALGCGLFVPQKSF
ncbi:MAG: type I-MYXAN CRISPR-associated protein Cas6/Cmx6 [Gammaproteobacteria bacterium]|nr:type I-MYXAN CRISPR-associated protein Cas6/Cmx6 [Gammaproteobacteria bacterium]